jgi:hypothetical protein
MKISSRIKQVLSISVVSVLAATVMPSTVSAEPQEYYYDDSVVTVEVDLGDGGGGDTGCLGISTLELPDSTLRARFDQLKPGISDPTTIDYLTWSYGSSGDEFTNADLENYLVWLQTVLESVGGGQFVLDPIDATVENLISISYTLTNGGFLSGDVSGPGGEPDGTQSCTLQADERRQGTQGRRHGRSPRQGSGQGWHDQGRGEGHAPVCQQIVQARQ